MPFFHVAGVNIGLLTLAQGAQGVVLGETDPAEILRLIGTKKVSYAFLVPALILFVVQNPAAAATDFSALKNISYGASPISDEVLLRAKQVFGCEFLQVYGLTETTGGGTFLLPEDHDPARGKLRSCGKPAPGHEIRIVGGDGKQAAARAKSARSRSARGNVMKGYWNKADATRQGDLRRGLVLDRRRRLLRRRRAISTSTTA